MAISTTLRRGIEKRAAQFALDLSDLEIEEIAAWGLRVAKMADDPSAGMACIDYDILERAGQIPVIDETKWQEKQKGKGDGDRAHAR
jgi:hypothetical protein